MPLVEATDPITSKGEHTSAPNKLPAPPATAGSTMGSKPNDRRGALKQTNAL
jgi:hypothetical protein